MLYSLTRETKSEGMLSSIGSTLTFFLILPLIGKFNDCTRFANVLGSAEGSFDDIDLILLVKWFPSGMAEGIVDEERSRRLNERGYVHGR